MAEQKSRSARVEIGKADNGQPSVKVDGREINMLISPDMDLRFVSDAHLGHWELGVTFVEPDVLVDVQAEVEASVIETPRRYGDAK